MISLKLKELDFADENHVYRLNGLVIPSVSRLIEPVSNAEYGSISPQVLQAAASRGTRVHSAIEMFNVVGEMMAEEDIAGYLDAYKSWFSVVAPSVEAIEMRVYHKIMRYAGTVDLLAIYNGKLTLVDYKTSYRLVDKNYRLQLEAYSQALKSHGINVARKVVLHLRPNGKYEEKEYPLDDREAWTVFAACKSIYDYANK